MSSLKTSGLDHLRFIERGSLFSLIKSEKLVFPTNSKFSASEWTAAFLAIAEPSDRDIQLYSAALLIANELATLREFIRSNLSKLSPEDAINFVVGGCNVQALSVIERSRSLLRRTMKHDDVGYIGDTGRISIQNVGGQNLNPDDAMAVIVDAFANLLFHATDAKRSANTSDRDTALQKAKGLSLAGSIEHGLRNLWQQVLWEAFSLERCPDRINVSPTDETLSKLWLAWQRRTEILVTQRATLEIGEAMARDETLQRTPLLARTIVGIERRPGLAQRYIVGKARYNGSEQYAMLSALHHTYIKHFLDVELPNHNHSSLKFRNILDVWWVIQDVARLHLESMGKKGLISWNMVDRSMLRISLTRLREGVSNALGLTIEQIDAAIDVLTTDPSNLSEIFNNGAWGRPIVRAPGEDCGRIIFAALNAPNPVLTAERWMMATGLIDKKDTRRGDVFEAVVLEQIKKSLGENPILTNVSAGCIPKAKKGEEQIDVLIRIGSVLVIAEAKCFNTPFASQDRYNHLQKLDTAAEQAARKTDWAKANKATVLAAAGVSINDKTSEWTLLPLVIINTPYGCGLKIKDCPITDHYWLTLLLGSSQVSTSGNFVRSIGSHIQTKTLYRSEKDLEAKFAKLVLQPPSLRSELGRIQWETTDFPSSNGDPFVIRSPVSIGLPQPN